MRIAAEESDNGDMFSKEEVPMGTSTELGREEKVGTSEELGRDVRGVVGTCPRGRGTTGVVAEVDSGGS